MNAGLRVLVWNNTTGWGGAEQSLLEFLTSAVEQGRGVRFFAANPPGAELGRRLRGLDVVSLEVPGPVHRRSRNPRTLLRLLAATVRTNGRLFRLLRRHRIDVLHANNTSAALSSALAARLAGVPLVWHVRDALPPPPVGRLLESLAARVVTVSDAIRDQVRHPEKATTIYNPILLASRLAAAGAEAVPVETPCPDVLMVAQFVQWKRHALMIDVIREVRRRWPRVSLLFVGACHDAGARSYVEELQRRVRRERLEGNVSFGGYRDDVYEILRRARVLVHPAVGEPMGRVVVEALLLKTPVIAARSGGVPELLGHGAYGELVEPDDVAGFAAAVGRALDGEPSQARIEEAHHWAIETFEAARQSRKLLDLYGAARRAAGERKAR